MPTTRIVSSHRSAASMPVSICGSARQGHRDPPALFPRPAACTSHPLPAEQPQRKPRMPAATIAIVRSPARQEGSPSGTPDRVASSRAGTAAPAL